MNADELSPGQFCRQVEAYLCRKNDGHLIRIVGPAFEQVSGWASTGIPLKVVFQGIDRYFERYYAKGPRRRPVRIEFCEADVLDAYDAWRRAVGAHVAGAVADAGQAGGLTVAIDEPERAPRRSPSLVSHLDRVLVRLSSFLASVDCDLALRALAERIASELTVARDSAKGLRGDRRHAALERLAQLDRELLDGAMHSAPTDVLTSARSAAAAELAPFASRMAAEAHAAALDTAVRRELRQRLGLPVLTLE